MLVRADDNHQVWDESSHDKTDVDHRVGKDDKPSVSRSRLQFTSGLGAGDRSSGVLSSDTDPNEESVGSETGEHAGGTAMETVCAGTECRKDDEDNGGEQEGVCAGPLVAEVAEEQLPNNCADEGDGSDVLLGAGAGVLCAIDVTEQSRHSSNNLRCKHVRPDK